MSHSSPHNGHFPAPPPLTHQGQPIPTPAAYARTARILNDEGEQGLYALLNALLNQSADLQTTDDDAHCDLRANLAYLHAKDPSRARLVRGCLHMARIILNEATELLNGGIEWPMIEALYCPETQGVEESFVDTPGTWQTIGRAEGENAAPNSEESTEEKEPRQRRARAASPGALRSLGRALRSEREHEMRRFYAIAQEHGLPTGDEASEPMRKALSALLEEKITSRKQLTATQWSKAASAIETEDLLWSSPPTLPNTKPSTQDKLTSHFRR